MKISEFSNKYSVTNDTVRYYMDLNLITPEKKGGHYDFDEKCELQLKEILDLKEMDFSLQEIKKIFNFKRIARLSKYQWNSYYQDIYKTKLKEINNDISRLINAKEKIDKEINELKSGNDDTIKIGINLNLLSLFSCPKCNHDLMLSAERVEDNQVLDGSLKCKCGYNLEIKDGIIYCNNYEQGQEIIDDDHFERYIENTDQTFMDGSYQSLEWLIRQLESENLSSKVILEPGSGYGHFLRQLYHKLPDDSIYICVDNRLEINKYLKNILEFSGKKANIIFITAELPELPLKENIIDLLFDYSGSSGFSFENESFLPALLEPYLKKDISYYATFIIYDKFGPKNIVGETYRKYFMYENIRDKIIKQGFSLEKEYKSESLKIKKSMGKYEDFAQIGDKISTYRFKAKR